MRTNLSVHEKVPSIVVYAGGIDESLLFECLYGIEEESIPYRLETRDISGLVFDAYEASKRSLLEVGIALNFEGAAVHYSHLKEEKPMFYKTGLKHKEMRRLGVNAARLVKGIPFILEGE